MIFPGILVQRHDQQQSPRSHVVGSENLPKCLSVGDISSLKLLREPLNTVSSVASNKTNLVDVVSCEKAYDILNELSSPLSVDASGMNSTDSSSIASAIIDDKVINNVKKKKKKKKKVKNSKSSENAVAQIGQVQYDQNIRASSFQSVNVENRTVSSHKNSLLVSPADNTSRCACGTNGGCLKDATNQDGKLISGCLCGGPFELEENFTHSALRNDDGDTVICGGGLKEIIPRDEEPKAIEKTNVMHCTDGCTKELKENLSLGDLSQCMSCGTDSIMPSTSEGSDGGRTDKTNLRSQNTSFRDADAVYPSGQDNAVLQSDVVDKARCHYNMQTGKENSHSFWQKHKKHNRDGRTHGVRGSNHLYIPKVANTMDPLKKYDPFSSNGLLPTPNVPSAGSHAFNHEVMKNKQGMYSRTHCNVLVESSQWIGPHKYHNGLSQVDSELRQDEGEGNKGHGKSKEKRNFSYKHENLSYSKKNAGHFKTNLLRFREKTALSQRESYEIPEQLHQYNIQDFARSINQNHQIQFDESHCSNSYPTPAHVKLNWPHTTMPDVLDCTLFPEVQQFTSMKIPRTDVSLEPAPFCLDVKNSFEDNIRQDINSRVSLQKWIPVGRKDSLKNEAVYASTSVKTVPDSCSGNADLNLENITPISFSPADSEEACLVSNLDEPKVMTIKTETLQLETMSKDTEHRGSEEQTRGYAAHCTISGTPLPYIGSEMSTIALNAAHRLQIVSEGIQLATGSPLAEFEKILHLASPVIAPSSALQQCDVCSGSQLPFTSLCKHQLANISLHDLWCWYEKPGSYGLEVRAEDSKLLKGMDYDPVSFNAHFVPYLSAIQLFSYPHTSQHINKIGQIASEIPENGEGECKPFHLKKVINESETLSGVTSTVEHDISRLCSAPSCLDDMELIFEYFENEQPQQRKPLYEKIRDLAKLHTSNHQVFGDPTRLDCMNLDSLHPASWYSVAWYPIYRIPEGNLRASFLTYHSLGHLVQKCRSEPQKENQYCVVSPILGLQSYNTQGECWFYPKFSVESSCKESPAFNSSEILKERLRTLEETALVFARGCVYKDNNTVTNRQPDYEFFLSRKR